MPSADNLILRKLAASGLGVADLKRFGMQALTPAQTKKLFPKHDRVALKISYYNPQTKKPTGMYRVRLLGEAPTGSFGEKDKKPLRYLQPEDSAPCAYFPLSAPWPAVFKDPEKTILITEGELKACAAVKSGFVCIGLGGVWSWRSAPRGWDLLPELKDIPWKRRSVVIITDSDGAEKPDVQLASSKLASALLALGALPQLITLPAVPDVEKTGLDDFLVARGAKGLRELMDSTDDDDLSRQLLEFNSRFAFVLKPGVVYDAKLDARYDGNKFVNYVHGNVHASMVAVAGDGKMKRVSVADEWVKWPCRREYNEFTYTPGAGPIVDNKLNEWRGWGCEPCKGSVKPWQELLDYMFEGVPAEDRLWFERWCLYPIAHPGTKMLTAVGLLSLHQGVGKSLVGETLGRVYGDNYSCVSQGELEAPHNSWMVKKQLVMLDDLSAHDSRSKADVMKKVITQNRVVVKIKYVPEYDLPDYCNFIMNTNKPNAFFMEDHDRRYFVHEVKQPPKPREFYRSYMRWLDEGGGPGALLAYAQTYNFGDFDPRSPAPATASKSDMIATTKSEVEQWLADLTEAPDDKLRLDGLVYTRDLFTPMEIFRMFDRVKAGTQPVSIGAVTVAVRSVLPPLGSGPLKVNGGFSERFFIARNADKWKRAKPAEAAKHILAGREKEAGQKGKRY